MDDGPFLNGPFRMLAAVDEHGSIAQAIRRLNGSRLLIRDFNGGTESAGLSSD